METPNAEFYEILTAPPQNGTKDMGARTDILFEVANTAVGGSQAVQRLNQTLLGTQQASVPASGRQMSMAPPEQMRTSTLE